MYIFLHHIFVTFCLTRIKIYRQSNTFKTNAKRDRKIRINKKKDELETY